MLQCKIFNNASEDEINSFLELENGRIKSITQSESMSMATYEQGKQQLFKSITITIFYEEDISSMNTGMRF